MRLLALGGALAGASALALPPDLFGRNPSASASVPAPLAELATAVPATLAIAEMTWPEVRAALASGARTIIVPSGGLEQNGPHMTIGKHDRIVAFAAEAVARRLGQTLVTPVVSFVPEGRHWPPTGHLRFPGTIGVTDEAFAATLDGIARSLKGAGFTLVALLADHGGSIGPQRAVADRLTREWAGTGVQVVSVERYYDDPRVPERLAAEGESAITIGVHGGLQDTSELLAVAPGAVRSDRYPAPRLAADAIGSDGDPSRASAERGQAYLGLRIDAAVAAIAAARDGARSVAGR